MSLRYAWQRNADLEWEGQLLCQYCAQPTLHQGYRINRSVTLNSARILPLNTDTRILCTSCGRDTQVNPSKYRQLAEEANPQRAACQLESWQRQALGSYGLGFIWIRRLFGFVALVAISVIVLPFSRLSRKDKD